LLPEKITVIKPIFTSIQNLKNKENLKVLLLLSVFLCLIISQRATASSNWEITPQNPVVGDVMQIKGTGFTGENAKVMVTFEKEIEVDDGSYEYTLENVVIPSRASFTVQATGADDLNVRAKTLLWITKSAEAKDGVATVSQEEVPEGTYTIRIDGKSNASSVKIKITAIQEMEVDSEGNISYEYDTSSIPAGNFEVKVEDSTKQIELQSSENLSSENLSSENSSEEQNNESMSDTTQEESSESGGKSHDSGLNYSSKNNTINASSIKNKVSPLMGIGSILETPKEFLFEDLKPYIKANSLAEVVKNPPKVPSFLLGFAGALLIGLAIMRKKK
jgi:hypothetical protein